MLFFLWCSKTLCCRRVWVLLIRSKAGWSKLSHDYLEANFIIVAGREFFGGFVSDKYVLQDFERMHFSLKRACAPEPLRAFPNSAAHQEEDSGSSNRLGSA